MGADTQQIDQNSKTKSTHKVIQRSLNMPSTIQHGGRSQICVRRQKKARISV
jgi:hypothetical protein